LNLKHEMLVNRFPVEVINNRNPVWKISAFPGQVDALHVVGRNEAVVVFRGEKGKFRSERVEI
jgi:hypothetical protein